MGSATFAYTGGWQKFKVPKRVQSVNVTLQGGGSGGAAGGYVSGSFKVTDSQTLWIMVGRAGRANTGESGGVATFGGGGAGGDGTGAAGGYSGGGASAIRVNSQTGPLRVVAGGAGGRSGDGGAGGKGGGATGENGFPGSDGPGATGNATGGTRIQGGNGGTSVLGADYNGGNVVDVALVPGGTGGSTAFALTVGGGGGGGGLRSGGGGQAGMVGTAPAGGGGGGSNYTDAMVSFTSRQGGGSTGNGAVAISWVDPAPANQPPSPPTEVKVNGQDAIDGQQTQAVGSVTISAKIDDPNAGQKVRLYAQWSAHRDFSAGVKSILSTPIDQAKRATVHLTGLSSDTLYYVRLYTRDSHGLNSIHYNSVNFYTNQQPTEPVLIAPVSGATVAQLASVVFQWTHQDPDTNSKQARFQLRWRVAATPLTPAAAWTVKDFSTSFNSYTANPGTFKANQIYEWTVRTEDQQGSWSPWQVTSLFFVSGNALAPLLTSPVKDEAVDVTVPILFQWVFRDPDQGDLQTKADLRWRVVGLPDWITTTGTTLVPGGVQYWTFDPGSFKPGYHYEWQVRTTDTLSGALSDWSESQTFWGIGTPGGAITTPVVPNLTVPRPALGVGNNRAFIYDRGGMIRRGEVTPLTSVTWSRKRDDIATCMLVTNGFGDDGGDFYQTLHSWIHEVVIYRDDERVAEGPITRIGYFNDHLEIEFRDVMAYVYRKIMRQGYNDSYRLVNGVVQGQFSVVERATKIIQNALAPSDPNLLPYLTTFNFSDDAGQSRVVPDYTKTAWEEIDDMAATAGLDYTTVGRRIMLWDTHRPIGRLAEMRSEHFSSAPIITEYGMQLAEYFGVTNGSGLWGSAERGNFEYGGIEMLASAYGETDASSETVLTAAASAELQKTLSTQAERNIGGRWPAPLIVRVPDSSTLDPSTNVGINDLVPGVWIPLRAKSGIKQASQWQKLDEVDVTQDATGERIAVTMGPAPNAGQDPDSDTTDDGADL